MHLVESHLPGQPRNIGGCHAIAYRQYAFGQFSSHPKDWNERRTSMRWDKWPLITTQTPILGHIGLPTLFPCPEITCKASVTSILNSPWAQPPIVRGLYLHSTNFGTRKPQRRINCPTMTTVSYHLIPIRTFQLFHRCSNQWEERPNTRILLTHARPSNTDRCKQFTLTKNVLIIVSY